MTNGFGRRGPKPDRRSANGKRLSGPQARIPRLVRQRDVT
jgi:hypothetical protein